MIWRRVLTGKVFQQCRRYATNTPPNDPKKRWYRAEFLSIFIPFAVLSPFFFWDKPFSSKSQKMKNT
jgi:hypothetical protein